MRIKKPYFRFFKSILVVSVLLLLIASDCDYTLVTEAEPPEGGKVLRDDIDGENPTPLSEKVKHNAEVRLEAVPNVGFAFSHWQFTNDKNPVRKFDMGRSKETHTAVFISLRKLTARKLTATISRPLEAQTFLTSDEITFSGSGWDPKDGNLTGDRLTWFSSLDGELGTGESITASLTAGVHSIDLEANGSMIRVYASLYNITVEHPPNAPPTASISSPVEGEVFLTSDSINFSGLGNDPEDGSLTDASLVWVSNLDGDLGTGEQITASLNAGNHVIALEVTDGQDVTVSESVNITVEAPVNATPAASIANPLVGETYSTADNVPFSGTGNDFEDGSLSGPSLVWTSDLDGQIGTGESFNAALSAGSHNITLTVTDSQQGVGIDSVSFDVNVPVSEPPTATITGPAKGDVFLTTDVIPLSGTGVDAAGVALTGMSLMWTSNLDGQIGAGATYDASLSAGQHIIALGATDSQDVTGSAFITIIVEEPDRPPTASIANPVEGDRFETGVELDFNGGGFDHEEGYLSGAAMVWSSDSDGDIGAGESFSASLSAGSHIITLTVTDGQGLVGSDFIGIVVVAPEPAKKSIFTPRPDTTTVSQPVPLPARAGGAPHLFFGSATLDMAPAPDGTVVTAWKAEFSDPLATAEVAAGQYKFSVFQYGTRSFAGKTITFKIGGVAAVESRIWESFGAEVLNLTAGQGAIAPRFCDPGTFSATGYPPCTDAPPGSFATPGILNVMLCPPRSFQPNARSHACRYTPAGHYVSGQGATSPTPCPVGTYNPDEGSESLTDCLPSPAGHFVSGTGAASSTPCPTGTYNDKSGSMSEFDCLPSPAGHYVSGTGAASATPCLPGTYNPSDAAESSSACLQAPLGSFATGPGAVEATLCSPGTFSRTKGSIACTPAPPGTFVSGSGAVEATPCPINSFSKGEGATSCEPCTNCGFTSSFVWRDT